MPRQSLTGDSFSRRREREKLSASAVYDLQTARSLQMAVVVMPLEDVASGAAIETRGRPVKASEQQRCGPFVA